MSDTSALVEELRAAIRRGTADEVNGQPNGDIIVKGCEAAEYVDPDDAAAAFVDSIVDEIRPLLEAKDRALAEAEGNLTASRNLVERRAKERDREAQRADGNWDAYGSMIRERDAAQTATLSKDQEIAGLREELRRKDEALASISHHYENGDLSHLDFRVKAAECARSALSPLDGEA